MPTESGRYRIAVTGEGLALEVGVWDAAGRRPVEDAAVRVTVGGIRWLVDPGECDAVGEARCAHYGGVYQARAPGARGGGAVVVEVDGPTGVDRLTRIGSDQLASP